MKLILLLTLLSGCGISVKVVDLQWGSTGYAEAMNKRTMNVQTGNQSALIEDDSNPITENQKYLQLREVPRLPLAK
jgi:hypothetical protein